MDRVSRRRRTCAAGGMRIANHTPADSAGRSGILVTSPRRAAPEIRFTTDFATARIQRSPNGFEAAAPCFPSSGFRLPGKDRQRWRIGGTSTW